MNSRKRSKKTSSKKTSGEITVRSKENVTLGDDPYSVQIRPVYTRPFGRNWLFFHKVEREFRRPTFRGSPDGIDGNDAVDKEEVEEAVRVGYKVWVMSGDYGVFTE